MAIVSHGVDLVEVERIASLLDEHGQRFLDRCFTAAEQAYAQDNRRRAEHLAGRFAAKEAVLKALGTGLSDGIAWTDVEVVRLDSGKPTIRLHARALEIASELGIERWHLSISHTAGHAMASVVAEGK
jgi:holo-[acyl-carrier protein] synthase